MKRYNSIILFRFVAFVTIIAAVSVTMVSGDSAADIRQLASKCKANPQCDAGCQKCADACNAAALVCPVQVCQQAIPNVIELGAPTTTATNIGLVIGKVMTSLKTKIKYSFVVDLTVALKFRAVVNICVGLSVLKDILPPVQVLIFILIILNLFVLLEIFAQLDIALLIFLALILCLCSTIVGYILFIIFFLKCCITALASVGIVASLNAKLTSS